MKIGIVGAGAIGGLLGVRLASAGHDVSVLARGATLEMIRTRGWQLSDSSQTVVEHVRASDDPKVLGEQDVIFICVKGPALTKVARQLRPMMGAGTVVVPAMNGVPWWFLLGQIGELPKIELAAVDPGGLIAGAIPYHSVLGCVIHISAGVPAPAEAVQNAGQGIILGEPDGSRSERLSIVTAALCGAGFDAKPSANIRRDIWFKLWGNMTMNPISALTGATCDQILDDPQVTGFVLRVMAEAKAIGTRIGCPIEEQGEDRIVLTRKLGAFKTSMLQDVEATRPIELDQFLSAPKEIARHLDMEVPNMDALLGLTRLFARTRGLYPMQQKIEPGSWLEFGIRPMD